MAAIKANGLIKYLVFILIGAVIFIGVLAYKGKNKVVSANTQPDSVVYDLTENEQKELGLTAGDTPHDTLKTLLGAMKQTRADIKAVREENEKLKQQNNTLRGTANNVNQQISEALEQQQFAFDQQIESLRHQMTSALQNQQTEKSAIPVPIEQYPIGGLGLDSEPFSQGKKGDFSSIKWVEPSDILYKDKSGNTVSSTISGAIPTYPNPFKVLDDSPLGQAAEQITHKPHNHNDVKNNAATPFFTIPTNSTLLGSTSMTALIGRIPLNGSVTDPYPFKVIVGQENLIANGIELPDVEGAIISGTVTGDWTLSCVRGNVDNITFVFNDGRIVTNQEQKSNSKDKSIGWLSNPDGVPCIPGVRKTNAPEYLTSQFLLAGASAAAQGLSQGQTTTVVDNGSVISAVTGNQGKFILGQALGGGLQETTEWLRQRYGQTFDAVYVPPGQAVAVHITQELKIDYNPASRKVKYHNSRSMSRLD